MWKGFVSVGEVEKESGKKVSRETFFGGRPVTEAAPRDKEIVARRGPSAREKNPPSRQQQPGASESTSITWKNRRCLFALPDVLPSLRLDAPVDRSNR